MARAHPTSSTSKHRPIVVMASSSSPALLHAAWITAVVGFCLALCTMHSRKPFSSSSRRRRGSRSASASSNHRCGSRESNGAACSIGTAAATPAKVSPTPSDAAAKASGVADVGGGGPVTVIDVGTHGPIPPVFLPPPDPLPPRRSLSAAAKHTRFAERVGRIRSMRRGGSSGGEAAADAAEDNVFVGCHRGGEVGEEGTLWTKTIILGERCRVPSSSSDEDDGVVDSVRVKKWKSYRPIRQPRSVPITRSNSFAFPTPAHADLPTHASRLLASSHGGTTTAALLRILHT